MKNPFLVGERVYLSPLTKEDISDDYVQWLNDPEVCQDNSHAVFPNTRLKAEAYIDSLTDSKTDMAFTIRLKEDDTHIGNAALQGINWINRSGDCAILIGNKEYWGKGIGTEVYRLLLNYGFVTLNLHRISSGQTTRNSGMIKVCEKVGMSREGVLRQALCKSEEYLDIAVYSILREEYDG